MVVKTMKSSGSTAAPLAYNEDKVFEGEADVFYVHNIENDSYASIVAAMQRLENLPNVSAKTKNFALHMTFNPGPGEIDDVTGEMNMPDYIDAVMDDIGFAEQPYVVYRHHDIERTHYHVVSVRVRSDGSVIDDGNDAYRIQGAQRKFCKKYGFSPAGESIAEEKTTVAPAVIYRGMPNVVEQVKANVESMLSWQISDAVQFRAAMMSLGVRASRKENAGKKKARKKKYWSFIPVDESGKPVCWPIKGSRVVDASFDTALVQHVAESRKAKKTGDDIMIMEAVKVAMEEARSVMEVRSALSQVGLYLHVEDANKKMPRKASLIKAAAVVAFNDKCVYSAAAVRLSLDKLRSLPMRTKSDRALPLSAEKIGEIMARTRKRKEAKKKTAVNDPAIKKATATGTRQ